MVTVDHGVRCTAADVADLEPRAIVAGLDQLSCVSPGVCAYVTCGNDDARAFARRLPQGSRTPRALLLRRHDALLLTERSDVEEALDDLARSVETVIVTDALGGATAIVEGRRHEVPGSSPTAPSSTRPASATCSWRPTSGPTCAAPTPRSASAGPVLYAGLSVTSPTAVGGAGTEAQLFEEGARRGLEPSVR
jgi:hypothetical protein